MAPSRLTLILLGLLAAWLLVRAAPVQAEPARLPRAVLVVGNPLVPGAAALSQLHQQLGAGYALREDPDLRRELESLDHDPSPEQLVHDALKEAQSKMRRLALEEVQRTLEEAEPYVQQLPPTPGGRSLLCTVAVRRAHVALLLGDAKSATEALQRGLSAAPDFTLDQALEPPTLVELFERVRAEMKGARSVPVRVNTSPPGATVVLLGAPQGPSPMTLRLPADVAVTLWAVQDGFRSRNVTAKAAEKGPQLSVEIELEPLARGPQLRPLLHALRRAAPDLREFAAQALRRTLHVDAIVVAQLGLTGRPRLAVYGAAPRWPSALPPGNLELVMETPPPHRRPLPAWLWGVLGGVTGAAVTTGIILGATR